MGLSWGDLFVLAGTTAIESMGGPVLGFCAGRIDDANGDASLPLGPTAEQEILAPCDENGACETPLGTTTVGLIYVNPEGPMGVPNPDVSATQVRDTFGRMAMNDTETVALIGGGHAFGKTHGACPDGPGDSPAANPENPWAGNCGTGKGADAFTSGFEGPWTTNPTRWDNEYFQNLVSFDWDVAKGPGGHFQWGVNNTESPTAPSADLASTQPIMMLTSDISLLHDAEYRTIVEEYAADHKLFDGAFSHAWYKLTSRDMGPHSRCRGDLVPPAQPFQYPLPPTPPTDALPKFHAVKEELQKLVTADPANNAAFAELAYSCASTFRQTDYLGGCDGSRIRLEPERSFGSNRNAANTLATLEVVKDQFGDALSYADLIVLAGNVAIENAASVPPLKFCGGRTDAVEGDVGSEYLSPTITGLEDIDIARVNDGIDLLGLTKQEFVALSGGHSLSTKSSGWTVDPSTLSHGYFASILDLTWTNTDGVDYTATAADGTAMYASNIDLFLKTDSELQAFAQTFAQDEDLFKITFVKAWTKLMNADVFYSKSQMDEYCA
jgi:catalase (peroxidase I)